MNIVVVGKNLTVTQAMRQAIDTKLKHIEKLFDKHDLVEANVTVSKQNLDQSVEIAIYTGHFDLRVKVSDVDAYVALDLAIDRLKGQMRKVKTQIERKRVKNANLIKNINFNNFEDIEDDVTDIVKRKSLKLVPMDEGEALARMEALGHSFFIYLDSSTSLVNVIYKRNDGTFGVIEVEN